MIFRVNCTSKEVICSVNLKGIKYWVEVFLNSLISVIPTRIGAAGGSSAGILLLAMEHIGIPKEQIIRCPSEGEVLYTVPVCWGTFQNLWRWKGCPSYSCYWKSPYGLPFFIIMLSFGNARRGKSY